MEKGKKALAYIVGATVLAGTTAYFTMNKDARKNVKDTINNFTKRKESNIDCKKAN